MTSLLELGEEAETTETTTETPPPAEGAEAPPPSEKSEAGEETTDKPVRPEGVPEEFWDEETGALKTEDLLAEVEKSRADRVVPEKYEVVIDEKYKEKISLPEDDPMLVAYQEHAKNKGYTQEKFQDGLNFFVEFMAEQATVETAAELENLGGEAQALKTIAANRTFLKSRLSDGAYSSLMALVTTADQIKAIDELRRSVTTQTNPPDNVKKGGIEGELTEEKLRALMKKPEYNDPQLDGGALYKKVTDGWEALYPDPI